MNDVNDCPQCNGEPRGWSIGGAKECVEHNVCRRCSIKRADLKDIPWGGRNGWTCKPCDKIEHDEAKAAALAAMPEEYDEWDYFDRSEITCPYCAYEFTDSWESAESNEEEKECDRCDNTFKFTAVHELTFNSERIDGES